MSTSKCEYRRNSETLLHKVESSSSNGVADDQEAVQLSKSASGPIQQGEHTPDRSLSPNASTRTKNLYRFTLNENLLTIKVTDDPEGQENGNQNLASTSCRDLENVEEEKKSDDGGSCSKLDVEDVCTETKDSFCSKSSSAFQYTVHQPSQNNSCNTEPGCCTNPDTSRSSVEHMLRGRYPHSFNDIPNQSSFQYRLHKHWDLHSLRSTHLRPVGNRSHGDLNLKALLQREDCYLKTLRLNGDLRHRYSYNMNRPFRIWHHPTQSPKEEHLQTLMKLLKIFNSKTDLPAKHSKGTDMLDPECELCNVVSFIAYCKVDNTMMLTLESVTSEYWIPCTKVPDADNWKSQINKETVDIFQYAVPTKLLKIYKIWLPEQQNAWLYHCVYAAFVSDEDKAKAKVTKGKYRGKVRWVTESELLKLFSLGNLKSPELVVFFNTVREHIQPNFNPSAKVTWAVEYIEHGKLSEIGSEILVSPGNNSVYEQLVDAAGFSQDMQKQLLREFIFFSYPSIYMGKQAFIRLVMELGWNREDCPWAFRSADISNRNGLSFREFLFILCAIDPNTSHGGGPAELRCRYIFRFFDRDDDNVLNASEFSQFIGAMRKSKSIPPDLADQMKDADAIYKHLGFSNNTQLTIGAFLVAVGTLKIRGTSHIFRSTKTAQQYLQGTMRREIRYKAQDVGSDKKKTSDVFSTGYKLQIESKGYELAAHSIRLQRSATLINVDQIWNAQAALSTTALSILQSSTPEQLRRVSIAVFNQESESNELLKSLRYLQHLNRQKTYSKGKTMFSWGNLDSEVFARHLINVCTQVQEILKAEPRLLDLSSPIYVMGDLHGNLSDLICFEKVFWHLGPCLCPCNLIFLGDYIDRGAYGLEVITYLICYKLQTPQKVYLLRGNHEIRDIQRLFSFYSECLNKFGNKSGEEVWEAVNSVFDCMPLAAMIDKKVFCTHGGIPPPYLCPVVSAINQIPVPLKHPDQESALAWELMWNDPVKKATVNDNIAMELMSNDGFATNTRRGTAHVFSVEALERFLNTNSFSHIIRAHEVVGAGYNVQQKAKLLTVFSSSKYCGGQNDAACILADQGKLRILRMETSSS